MNNFFKAIKAIHGPFINGPAPLLSSDGTTLLTEKSKILKRSAEHFRSVINCSSATSDAAIDRLCVEQPRIRITYRTDGRPPSIRRMQASMRVSTTTFYDLLFTVDCAPNIVTEEDMQTGIGLFAESCANFGLTIKQPPPSAEYNVP
ncbi:unnamed protein product [Schistocephalus solidus]|uniref:Uncharacterized protein n=1 Tax=Schistocephalus solidus TaxID=70667 RepID=A0A183ST68_SCHSO|nr:unnamed protein product [Schistocephalus solidus]